MRTLIITGSVNSVNDEIKYYQRDKYVKVVGLSSSHDSCIVAIEITSLPNN